MFTSPTLSEFASACAAIFCLSSSRICLCTALSSVLSPSHGFSTLKLLICCPRTTMPNQVGDGEKRDRRKRISVAANRSLLAFHILFCKRRAHRYDNAEIPSASHYVQCTPLRSLYARHEALCSLSQTSHRRSSWLKLQAWALRGGDYTVFVRATLTLPTQDSGSGVAVETVPVAPSASYPRT